MTPQEARMLDEFLQQLVDVRGIPKDPAAEQAIAQAVARQPDAAYLLVQRSLLLQQAVEASQAELEKLKAERAAPAATAAPSFLDANAWGRRPAAPAAPAAASAAPTAGATSVTGAPLGAPAVAAGARAPMQAAAPAARGGGMFGGGAGSFLGTAAMTAAGVAGGAFLFQGINHLLHRDTGAAQAAATTPDPMPAFDARADDAMNDRSATTAQNGWDDTPADDGGGFDSAFDDGGDSDWA